MAHDTSEKIPSPPHTALRLINDAIQTGAGYDNLITVLSLWCLLLILQRQTPSSSGSLATSTSAANPLQKLLSELGKGDGSGPSPDALMSLLPLLNSPQIKSKMNPANIAAILSLVNSLGASGGDKNDSKHEKAAKEKAETRPEEKVETKKEPPAATVTTSATDTATSKEITAGAITSGEKKDSTRSLNWKNL